MKGTWNHRVVKVAYEGETFFGIHEAYYGPGWDDLSWTEKPVAPVGETIEELRHTLERMLAALDKPIIDDSMEQ